MHVTPRLPSMVHIVRRLIALTVLAAALFGASVGTANASLTPMDFWFADGFEKQPSGWSFGHVGNASGGVGVAWPRTGSRHASLRTESNGSWSTVYRTISVPGNAINPPMNCQAEVFVAPALSKKSIVAVEVIHPTTWRYIAYKGTYVAPYSTGKYPYYHHLMTDRFVTSATNLVVRVTLGHIGTATEYLFVDDLFLSCYHVNR